MLSARQSADWERDWRARARQVAACFRERFGGEPELWARAPGRVDLMGSHTDYNLGFVLTLPISRDTWIAARRRGDATVRVHSMNLDASGEFRLDRIASIAESTWCNYVRGVAAILQDEGLALTGCDAIIHSTVPVASGLSSSAALECAAATVFEALGGWSLTSERKALLCQKAENEFVGIKCGHPRPVFLLFGPRGVCAASRLPGPLDAHRADCRRDLCDGMQHDEPAPAVGRRIRATPGGVRAGRRPVERECVARLYAGDAGGETR